MRFFYFFMRDHGKPSAKTVSYVNRKGREYFLHKGTTKKGNPKYYKSMKQQGEPVEAIPEGHEIHEDPNARVSLRKRVPKLITDAELESVDRALKRRPRPNNYRLDVKGEVITVFESNQGSGEPADEFQPFFGAARMQE
jgi:hypothetical protein